MVICLTNPNRRIRDNFWKTRENFPSSRTSYVPARASDEDLANELNAHRKFPDDLVPLRADPAARAGNASVLAVQPAERAAPIARRQQIEPALLRYKPRAVPKICVFREIFSTIMPVGHEFANNGTFYFTDPILIGIYNCGPIGTG